MSTRNLIICCDGTWNDTENMDGGEYAPTNVKQFDDALAKVGNKQLSYYEDGVGTRPMEALPGGMYGYGLDKRILGAYRWLSKKFGSKSWEHEQNKIFLLGFSRGAYTARRIAGLVDYCGIAKDPNDDEFALEVYKSQDKQEVKQLKNIGRFFDVSIEMVGVWDTVKTTLDPDFNDNILSANVVAGYHAMAIDEKRSPFKVLKWKKDSRVLQKWFAGVHCDVGGGYKEAGLADCAFMWMVNRAFSHGVVFDADVMTNRPDPNPKGKIHNSYQGIWKILPKKIRTINKNDLIDVTVKTRLTLNSYNGANRPKNLPADPKFTSDDD